METVKVIFNINQLGNAIVYWVIPNSLLENGKKLKVQLPSFKYDLPKLIGTPVPFCSKAIPLKVTGIKAKSGKLEAKNKLKTDKTGNFQLCFKFPNPVQDDVQLSYQIDGIVNCDSIYFVCVYPFLHPFDVEVNYEIKVFARFSRKLRTFKFREWYFDSHTGKKLPIPKIFHFVKEADLIRIWANNLKLNKGHELDIHISASRFPFMIRRDYFWFIIFLISLTILLSPIWTEFLPKQNFILEIK